ncbi:MAG: hypothetical protein JNK11_13995 [Alphaproteobacteria bacterium]|nr:hypothetical protein [Alphaproteobacteria bacterium]
MSMRDADKNDPAYAVAEDALKQCAKYATSKLNPGIQMIAMKSLDACWEEAPRKQIIGRKRPQSGDELARALLQPCRTWLPYAEALGVAQHPLLSADRKATDMANWIAGGRR